MSDTVNYDEYLPITRLDMVTALIQVVRGLVSPIEFAMVMFVYERTYLWGKLEDDISVMQFSDGIFDRHKKLVTAGLHISRASIYRVRKQICDKGFVTFNEGNSKNSAVYSLNVDGILSHVRDANVSSMRLNRLTHETNSIRKPIKGIHKDAPVHTHVAREALSDNVTGNEDMAATPAKQALEALLHKTTQAHRENKKARAKKMTATGYMAAWQLAFEAHFPDDRWFPWTVAQQSAFKRAIAKVPDEDRELFVDFIVRMWDTVLRERFGWMKQKPETPMVGFATKRIQEFYQAYQYEQDPNRKLTAEMRRAKEDDPPKRVRLKIHSQSDKAKDDEIEKLRAENDKLKTQVVQASVSRIRADTEKRRIRIRRRKVSPEFGHWPDSGR